ncbi:telomere-protecting terminal protein Tpg [Streptomyces sp. NPDC060275]|uniref:telomere-protecting terminal protein Tpg n=1 Tax=Streptomyces sp. NPDC060275 TaxID=3347090 RepID=UPI00364BE190
MAVVDVEEGQVLAHRTGGLVLDVPARSLPALVEWTLREGRLGRPELSGPGKDAESLIVLTEAACERYAPPVTLTQRSVRPRARARRTAATTGGTVIDTRARIGYTAPTGTTDEGRLRHLTVALPPQYAARLVDAQERGAADRQLRQIAAEALKEVYFLGQRKTAKASPSDAAR